ncbi:L,D-transpeptidase [Nocardioides sp.]|uniref:L,D-transpeptidase n=1 Tax=Nocardioides sp. TaxID=35761 RepID=UPI003D11B95B
MSVRRIVTALSIAALTTVCLTACDGSAGAPAAESTDGSSSSGTPSTSDSSEATPVTVTANVKGRGVAVDSVVKISAEGGTLEKVTVKSPEGALAGAMESDGTWVASDLLEPGTTYVVKSVAMASDGSSQRSRSQFHTKDLTLDQQTYASVAPLDGETVGVGMPVIVTFDVPVTDKASIEKHLKVTSTPAQKGSWHWISSQEVHWRPKTYWKSGTDVAVDIDVNSVPAGNGIFGQEDRHIDFHVGSANIYKVNAQTHQMKVYSNGELLRTLPITTGKPGFTTRSGTKVIIEKFSSKRMNSETVGIAAGSPDAYDIDDVKWAMRVTYSGEFIHGAPWSVASQGYDNVSHGCTGMSDANAKWLYDMSKRGDVVEYTGTDRQMTLTNGYGDWNESYATYAGGSAL